MSARGAGREQERRRGGSEAPGGRSLSRAQAHQWETLWVRGDGDQESAVQSVSLTPKLQNSEASLYNMELFTIEISQSTVLSEKISESQ